MADFSHSFTTARTTEPDLDVLQTNLKALDPSAYVGNHIQSMPFVFYKSTDWLAAHITAAQNVLDTTSAVTDESRAQSEIDRMGIVLKATVLVLIDEINILRTAAGLTPRTPVQAIAAIRTKAATL